MPQLSGDASWRNRHTWRLYLLPRLLALGQQVAAALATAARSYLPDLPAAAALALSILLSSIPTTRGSTAQDTGTAGAVL